MKIKELQKTVNIGWSPDQQNPLMLAAGTAAQQIDASFGTPATLELYAVNLSDPGYDMELKASQTSPHRFQKVIWSPIGFGGQHPNGLVVGGCEGGHLQVYSASKLLGGEQALIAHQEKHIGAVRALDFNPFQHNLLASAASESEILIWDLNNTTTPMTPGTKTQPFEDVQSVAWNKQVQHILASVFPSRCVIWDLRKNEPIIKLSDTQSRVRWRVIQWHPEIATQLWLASEEDQAPVVQLWDLRYATSPAKTMQIHQRGVLGLTWCPKDIDLMVSCGKDNKILCWNPNSELPEGEILSEIATTNQWYSDVSWCPRNPALVATSSLDGNVAIYSLFGGSQQQIQTSNKIADSFPGMDAFDNAPPVPQNTTQTVYADLKKPPKWLKKPCGASFGFGGKLITFCNKTQQKMINIKQVITEPELIERSNRLEEVLSQGNFSEYCRQKADQTQDQHDRFVWYFLKANFDENPRAEMLNLLGYHCEDMTNKFSKYAGKDETITNHVDQLTDQMAGLSRSDSSDVDGDQSTDDSTDLSGVDNNAVFDAIADGQKLLTHDKSVSNETHFKIKTGDDTEGLICQALLTGNTEAAVEICMSAERYTDAIIIAISGGSELLAKTQYRYLKNNESYVSNIISALVTEDWSSVVSQCTVDSWKEALVAALTHSNEQMPILCEKLGERLQSESDGDLNIAKNAILCYICAGNVEQLVDAWPKLNNTNLLHSENITNIKDLQDLIEIVMLLQKAIELQGRNVEISGKLAELLSRYAGLLAAQGSLSTALTYLGPSTDPTMEDLRDRLYYSLGHKVAYGNTQYNQQQGLYGKTQQQQPINRFNQQRNSIPNSISQPQVNFSTGLQSQMPQMQPMVPQTMNSPWNAPIPSVPPINAFNQGPTLQAQIQPPLQAKPPIAPPLLDPLSQPARPSSVGPQGSVTRSKYLLDPSVQSGPNYGGVNNNMYNPQQNQNYGTQTYGGNVQNQQAFNQFGSQPSNMSPQAVPPFQTQSQNFKPFQPSPVGGSIPLGNNPNIMNPGNYMNSGMPQIETAQPAMTLIQKNPTPPPGWNDPPALKSSGRQPVHLTEHNLNREMSAEHAGTRKWRQIIQSHSENVSNTKVYNNIDNDINKLTKTTNINHDSLMLQPKTDNFMQQGSNAITHPLFGTDNQQQTQNGYLDPNQQMNQMMPPNQYQQQQSQMPPTQFNPQFNQMQSPPQTLQQQQHQQQQAPVAPVIEPPPPKVKPPLPEEYVYMQTVFEELRLQCISSAGNPQTKRKLEDVAKRLEFLYDMLRENRLTQNTLASLNQLVQLIQIGDYANALALHTQMVSGPDFSQIASFMPGIKVLLQSAMQLQVYLR